MPANPLTAKTAPASTNSAAPALAPLLKKLVIFQLAMALLWVLASVAYALLISSSQQQTGIELQAQDPGHAFSTLPGALLAGGWAMTLLVSLATLLAVNRQLRKESMSLTGKLPVMPGREQTGFQHAGAAPFRQHNSLPGDANSLASAPAEYVLMPVALVEAIALAEEQAANATLAPKADLTPSASLLELELAQQSAVKANRIKSNIIAKTSHELLTPLNSIAGFAEILANDLPKASQHGDFAQLIYENALYLNTLVNDLIVFSDRETNAVKLNYARTDIHALLSSIAKTFAPAAANHGLEWRENLSAVKLIHCDTDAVRLRQIISNLLTNALRNTEHGHIGMDAQLEETSNGTSFLILSISDSGCGIAADAQTSIFSAFVSNPTPAGSNNNAANTEPGNSAAAAPVNNSIAAAGSIGLGFGLGLAIVDDLCSRLGASIELDSEINQGSKFTVRLPVRNLDRSNTDAPAQAMPQQAIEAGAAGHHQLTGNRDHSVHHIMIVDDIACNRLLLQHLLQSQGFTCSEAAGAEEALALISEQQYALLFIDIRMAPIDGITLLKQIRKLPNYRKTPAIGCTAHVAEHERRKLIDSGFTAVLHKPISATKVSELCNQLLNGEHGINASNNTQDHSPINDNTVATGKANHPAGQAQAVKPATHAYQVDAAIAHCGGNAKVAREICELILAELQQALAQQKQGFADHNAMLDHYHRLNGSASMGGTATLKNLLHDFETLLKSTTDSNHPEIIAQQQVIQEHQSALLAWLQDRDLDRLFS